MPGDVAADDQGREPLPMMVADDAHVTYRVHASGKRVGPRESLLSLSAARGGRELKAVHALRGVTFTAREGETIGVIGHNGSGKSTLFKAMSGLIPTSEGRIWARDRPVLLGVNAALVPELSGEDNIKLGLLAMGFSKAEAAEHVDEIADFAELNEFIHHPMRTYSSGMGARLRFAIASAKTHSILLIDEALAVGDRKFRTKSEQRIRNLRDSAGLVMIVSHSVSSLRDSCERVLWIHKGELRADGPAGPVIRDYIKWTKDPQSFAVGGTHMVKPNPRPRQVERTSSPVEVVPRVPAGRSRRADQASSGGIEEVFGGLIEPAGVVSTAPAPESSRTIARRERYRQTVRARKRRRVIAVVATIVTLLVAAAAGAAIALLANAPEPATAPAAAVTSENRTAHAPTIDSFAVAEPTTMCENGATESAVALSWTVSGAVKIALASATTHVDALESPTLEDLPKQSVAQTMKYPCAHATHAYTLTAQSSDGSRTSASLVVERVSAVADSSGDVETTSPDAPVSGSVPQSDPVQVPGDSSDPEPAPSAQPSPTSPVPDPQPTEVPDPEPSEPTPEPTANPEPVVTPDPLPTIDLPLPGSSEPTG
ncbi:ATP-binding cassette domain-containing protein [Microbacterium sp. NPDC077663]|uniref:ABC transporter ATP-binding protein n=1 Tax=Microbacterium sp. NPDC077663 TaxID=3364189 RepID=UPI0037C622E5